MRVSLYALLFILVKSQVCDFLMDKDYYGNDIRTVFSIQSKEECCNICYNEPLCNAFTYSAQSCYLKTRASDIINWVGSIAGKINKRDYFEINHTPLGVLFDKDTIITISLPRHIHFIELSEQTVVSIELPLAPSCFSLDRKTNLIAVGHDAYVTFVNYTNIEKPTIIGTYSTHVVASSVAIYPPYVYIFPTGQWEYLVSVNLTGHLVRSTISIYGGCVGKIHPTQVAGYYLTRGLSPADMGKWNPTFPPTKESESPYHGDYSYGTNFWYSFDGTRVFSSSGNTFVASINQEEDYLYQGSLGTSVIGLSQSTVEPYNIVGLLPSGYSFNYWNWPYLVPISTVPLPPINNTAFKGSYIFYSTDGSKVWIVGSLSNEMKWFVLSTDSRVVSNLVKIQ